MNQKERGGVLKQSQSYKSRDYKHLSQNQGRNHRDKVSGGGKKRKGGKFNYIHEREGLSRRNRTLA